MNGAELDERAKQANILFEGKEKKYFKCVYECDTAVI